MTLIEFLRARLDEDEAAAREADTGGRWRPGNADGPLWVNANMRHMARHDPARVLAEVEAKRFLLEWGIAGIDRGGLSPVMGHNILAGLALPYADHPDYDPSWKPE